MDAQATQVPAVSDDIVDEIMQIPNQELWSWDLAKIEAFQLDVLKKRFDDLRPKISQLDKLATLQKVDQISSLNDVTPLLFQHTVYKSYPISLVEKGRFDLLTRWLDGVTSHDLSKVDVAGCKGFDDWFDALEAQSELLPNHSTGTTGKLSVIPRDRVEVGRFEAYQKKAFEPFGEEHNRLAALKAKGTPVPIVYPSYRHGRHIAQRMLSALVRQIGSEETTYVMYNELMSADVASLVGRVRGASMRGDLESMNIDEDLLKRFKSSIERQNNQAQLQRDFFERILSELKGRDVLVFGVVPQLYEWARLGEERGIEQMFGSDSIVISGGGLKGVSVPDDWQSRVEKFLGSPLRIGYGMSESITSNSRCPEGKYHPLPFTTVFVLDPETGDPLPRQGTQTGRFALFDTLAQSFWGGFVTGDKVTVNWDGCKCGRSGPHFESLIERFSDLEGGDDKISCSGSVDAHEEAMAWLVSQTQDLE